MKNRLCVIGLAVAMAGGAAIVGAAAAGAGAAGTTHRLVAGSVQNYSAAVESPTWTFTCDTKTTAWTFRIENVQVMDSHAHPWKDSEHGVRGPWQVGMFTGSGGALFNASATLQQNVTNGLFRGAAHGIDPGIAGWCLSGASLTAFAFSGAEQPLLLDATLS